MSRLQNKRFNSQRKVKRKVKTVHWMVGVHTPDQTDSSVIPHPGRFMADYHIIIITFLHICCAVSLDLGGGSVSSTQTVFRSVEEETKRRNNHTHDERKQELINIRTESSFSSLQFDLLIWCKSDAKVVRNGCGDLFWGIIFIAISRTHLSVFGLMISEVQKLYPNAAFRYF